MASIFVLKSEYSDYEGTSTQLWGAAHTQERADNWVAEMEARVKVAKEAQEAINQASRAWVKINPAPAYVPPPELTKVLFRTPKKARTPEQLAAIKAAKDEMDRLHEEAKKPIRAWEEQWGMMRAAVEAKWAANVIADVGALPLDHEFGYNLVEVLE